MRLALYFAASLPLVLVFDGTANSQTFGQEKVETRAYRVPQPLAEEHSHGDQHRHDHGLETENLYGFTLGSDVEPAGTQSVAVESIIGWGKPLLNYTAVGAKIEYAYGLTDSVSVALSLLGAYHNIRNKMDYTVTENVGPIARFNGIGGEVRWNILNRKQNPFGVTLHIEPVIALSDELTGIKGIRYGSENKLIFEREIIDDKLFAAINLFQEIEAVKEKGSEAWERGQIIGVSLGISTQVYEKTFLGVEAKYAQSYGDFSLNSTQANAFYIGPTLYSKFTDNAWISLAWNAKVGGKQKVEDELSVFDQNRVRIKIGMEF
jgi:hypothetical protein